MHGDCHVTRAASAGERAIFAAGVAELGAWTPIPEAPLWIAPGPAEAAVARLLMLCSGCRS
jgi:hypothetical protein